MTSIDDLKEALKDNLEAKGVLNDLRAQLREQIFKALETDVGEKPKLSHDNVIINDLIREYLLYNNYHHSLSVFLPETGQPAESLDRETICRDLGLRETGGSQDLPLLYGIIGALQHRSISTSSI
eukprot:GCRY01003571.1.p1 GENE.GCRY01003571.1~~GCRY01003571.1.p1  ORF type:complete len:125 (+),score=11.79 GCRY01003571.1:246-620(+)